MPVHVGHETGADRGGIAERCGTDIGNHRHSRCVHRDIGERLAITSAAGCVGRRNRKGAETGSRMARFGALCLGDFKRAFDRRLVTGDHHLAVSLLSFAAWQTSPCAASAATADAVAKSSPRSAAMAPMPTGVAPCMACPRVLSSRAASVSENVPAAANSTEYSPSEWPATNVAALAAVMPCSASYADHRHGNSHQRRLGILG